MHSDSYRTYIKSLNAAAPFYPFGEMRALVMNHDARRRSAFAAFYNYAAGIALLAMLGFGGYFLANEPVPNTHLSQVTHVSHATHPSHLTDRPALTKVAMNATKNAMQCKVLKTGITNNTNEIQLASTMPQHSTVKAAPQPSDTKAKQAITTPVAAPSVPATIAQISGQNETAEKNCSAFITGGSIFEGNSYSTSSIFGAVGVRYRILGSSSFVVELRRSSFVVNHAAQTGNAKDTMVTVGGYLTHLTLGGSSQPATTSTSLVNSLDVGYRFDLNPNDMLSPCAEILAGASTIGFLSSEAVGVEYRFANRLSLDMSARAEQIFSPATSPLGSIGLEATLGFQW